MTDDELQHAIDNLHAYDIGAGGFHDEALRARVVAEVRSLPSEHPRLLLARIMREVCLSEDALDTGCGWEDAVELASWYQMHFGLPYGPGARPMDN